MKKQVGLFSGSFNPIHVGHLILPNYMCAFTYLDEVWFVVSPQNPLKEASDLLDDNIRLKMTKLALADYEKLFVSDIEFSMPRPSYTIDTLTKLSLEHPDKEFTLIIGADNWRDFPRWKEYERIRRDFRILIYPRLGEEVVIDEAFRENVCLVNAPIVEVSSTFIRKSIQAGKNVRAFVPAKVYDFVEENGLYR